MMEAKMNVFVVCPFDPTKVLNFQKFKEVYTNNAKPALAD